MPSPPRMLWHCTPLALSWTFPESAGTSLTCPPRDKLPFSPQSNKPAVPGGGLRGKSSPCGAGLADSDAR